MFPFWSIRSILMKNNLNNIEMSKQNQNESELSPKQLRKKLITETGIIAVISLAFSTVFMILFANNAYKLEVINVDINFNIGFLIFTYTVTFISFLVFCFKKQNDIILKELFVFGIFSVLCALLSITENKLFFAFIAAGALICAAAAIRMFSQVIKKLFISLMTVLFLVSLLNGRQQMFSAYSVEFSVDYFYILSKPTNKSDDTLSNHYSLNFYSTDTLSAADIADNGLIISSYEQFKNKLLNTAPPTDGMNSFILYKNEGTAVRDCLANMIKNTDTYNEQFFSEYILMPYCVYSYYPDVQINIEKVTFKGLNSIIDGTRYITDGTTESDEIQNICVCLIKIKKSDVQKLLSQTSSNGNHLSGGNDYIKNAVK